MKSKRIAVLLGLFAAFFFAITFILNRLMSLDGGDWIWAATFRFYWMLILFLPIVLVQKKFKSLLVQIKRNLFYWIIWSTIGFGLFYAPLTYAAAFSPSWLVASTWQVTIIAGMILAPLINKSSNSFQKKRDYKTFLFPSIILLGIIIMQWKEVSFNSIQDIFKGIFWILIAAFAYPLGNRKMMQHVNGKLDTFQRILGMVICSLPFWILLSIYGICVHKTVPSSGQYLQTFLVGLFSGLVATVLFFKATEKVNGDEKSLAIVEATQSVEVLFTLAGEVVLFNAPIPNYITILGIVLVVIGMVLHSFNT